MAARSRRWTQSCSSSARSAATCSAARRETATAAGGQGRQDLLGDQRVHAGAGQGLAALARAVVGQLPGAHVLGLDRLLADVVAHGHAPAAAPAPRYP